MEPQDSNNPETPITSGSMSGSVNTADVATSTMNVFDDLFQFVSQSVLSMELWIMLL